MTEGVIREFTVKNPHKGCSICDSKVGPQYCQTSVYDGSIYTYRLCGCCHEAERFAWVCTYYEIDGYLYPDAVQECLCDYAPILYDALYSQWRYWTQQQVHDYLALIEA